MGSHVTTVSGLEADTEYDMQVTAINCEGTAETSPVTKRSTTANIVIPGDTDNEVTVYIDATYVLTGVDPNQFSIETFFLALVSTLQSEGYSASEVSRSRFAELDLKKAAAGITLNFQQRTTSLLVEDMKDVLESLVSNDCSNPLVTRLISFSSNNEYNTACITMTASPSHSTVDATAPSGSSDDDEASWKLPVIIAGSIVGGIIIIGAAVFLILEMRLTYPKKERSESKVNLGVELRDASLY